MAYDVNLTLTVYLDEVWPEVEALEDVCQRPQHARQTRSITLPASGAWGDWIDGELRQTVRPHIWYFALSDCEHELNSIMHRLRFEFRARQEGGSEFSIEMAGMLLANVVFLMAIALLIWRFSIQTVAFHRSTGSVHPVIWGLSSAILIQLLAQSLHTAHLCRYSFDGSGVKALEVLSEILFMMSQVTQTSLLILIALGYTLLQSKIGELDLMIPMCFMVGIIHIMLVGFGKIKDDASYKFHENEGVVGWILMSVRLLLYAWFLWAVQSSAAEGGTRLRQFLSQFRVAGSIYFLSYPFIFLATKCFAPYWQHTVMSVGLMVMQTGSNLWLGSLFLTRGEYFRVSTLSSSELPGGTKFGIVKEE
eukprot:CAMPEP_0176068552 /NCGR_PEP_ID=MMETSP0120_2-20121206/34221_1 /TAXON_ID=160619 /ORGANISM="Kryptoperidinium foliaceum, Strain CCMP 1326" /LENGTH=362 /DNA_ID=CAMNT_0017402175 /DNA_START=255 /DNA_END=1343 /DNA_ORIENTATION=-